MSTTYKVQAIAQVKPFQTRDGKDMISYKLDVTDGSEVERVELVQVAATPAPQVGGELYGDITDGNYGPRFKKARKDGGDYQGGGGQKSDETQAAIRRQAAQRTAVMFLGTVVEAGFQPFREGAGIDELVTETVEPLVAVLEKSVAASAPAPPPQAHQTAAPAPVPAPIQQALAEAGVPEPTPEPETIGADQAVELLNRADKLPEQAVRVALIAAGVHDTTTIEDAIKTLAPDQAATFSTFLAGAEAKAA